MWFSKDECIFSEWLHACFQEWMFYSTLRYRKRRFRGRMKAAELMFAVCFQPLLFSHSVVSDSLWPHGLQRARLPCPSPSPGVCSNSCSLSQWCHPNISSSVPLPSNTSVHYGISDEDENVHDEDDMNHTILSCYWRPLKCRALKYTFCISCLITCA